MLFFLFGVLKFIYCYFLLLLWVFLWGFFFFGGGGGLWGFVWIFGGVFWVFLSAFKCAYTVHHWDLLNT